MDSKGKIAFVLKGYPRVSETFIAQEIYYLEQMGLDIEILSMRKAREPQRQPINEKIKAPVTYIPEYIRQSPFLYFASFIGMWSRRPLRFMKVFFKALGPTLKEKSKSPLKRFFQACWVITHYDFKKQNIVSLHSHFIHTPTEMTYYIHLLTGIPFSISAHAKDIYTISKEAVIERINASLGLMTCTQFNYDFLLKLEGIEKTKVNKIYHGVNPDFFTPSELKALDTSKEKVQLVSIGRLVPKKGYDIILKALKSLKSENFPFHYDIYGQGDSKDELLALVKELDLEQEVKFHFTATHPQILERLKQKGIFLMGSRVMKDGDKDGIPNTLAEAMSMEVPCIATDVSGIPELANKPGENAIIIPSENSQAFADAIKDLSSEPERADQIGKAGRVRVIEFFNVHDCIKGCFSLINSIFEKATNLDRKA